MTGTPADLGRPKWGILGSGKICQDWTSSLVLNGSSVLAVAARSLDSAKAFAERFEIPRSYGSYSSLLEDEEVQIVYVGTIHTHHCALVLEALEKGKHVLCEKPMGMNSGEVKRMVDLAKSKGLFLMENMWTRSFPATRKVADIIASGSLGAVVTCTADLGFVIPGEPPSISRLISLLFTHTSLSLTHTLSHSHSLLQRRSSGFTTLILAVAAFLISGSTPWRGSSSPSSPRRSRASAPPGAFTGPAPTPPASSPSNTPTAASAAPRIAA